MRPGGLNVNLFHQLTEKPWAPMKGAVADARDGGAFSLPTAALGLRVFLAVATVLFSLSVVAYHDRMAAADWRPLPEPALLWLNTALLVLSSAALQWACIGARRGRMDGVKFGLLLGGVFAFAFLAGQLLAWRQLVDLGYFAAANPSVAFFYLLTGLHAAHLLGGLVAWGRTIDKVWRGVEAARFRLSVELCALYWHFLLLVWLVLFALLLFT